MDYGNRRYKRRTRAARKKKSIGTMDVILVIVGISLLAFTVAMILIFRKYGAVPDTLVTCVFAVLGGECGVMGWIKTTKERRRERSFELEDREYEEEKQKEMEEKLNE